MTMIIRVDRFGLALAFWFCIAFGDPNAVRAAFLALSGYLAMRKGDGAR